MPFVALFTEYVYIIPIPCHSSTANPGETPMRFRSLAFGLFGGMVQTLCLENQQLVRLSLSELSLDQSQRVFCCGQKGGGGGGGGVFTVLQMNIYLLIYIFMPPARYILDI
jgi:hypothetical protein